MGTGHDKLNIAEEMTESTVNMAEGNDEINIGQTVTDSTINMGSGHDNLNVNISSINSTINMGDGNDSVNVSRVEENTIINTGSGNDHVVLDDVSSGFDAGMINLDDGRDTLIIHDSLEGTDAIFNGGNGIDNLILTNVSQESWDNGLSDQFINFENITLGGDATPVEVVEEPEVAVLPPENNDTTQPEVEVLPVEDDNILVSENFEDGAEGWSVNTITESDGNATNFLGRFGGTNGEEGVSKTYDFGVESAGKVVTIEFDMYEIDSWDDENFNVFVNGTEASSDTMSHFGRTWSTIATDEQDGGTELDALGSSGKEWLDHEESHHYTMDVTLDENGQVQLGFGSTLDQSLSDESFGIDNVEIQWSNTESEFKSESEFDFGDFDFDSIQPNDQAETPADNEGDNNGLELSDLLSDEELLFDEAEELNQENVESQTNCDLPNPMDQLGGIVDNPFLNNNDDDAPILADII
jgi:hypothetical protein